MTKQDTGCSFCGKSYQEVGPLVEGPGNVYICGECVELSRSIIHQERRRRSRSAQPGASAGTPEVIRTRLDRLVNGQDEAKQVLVAAADRRPERPAPVLLIGPSRSTRLFLARALAHILEVPFAAGDAGGLVSAAGGAHDIPPLLYDLLVASDFDVEAAQQGIVYLDGVDQQEAQDASLRLWQQPVAQVAGRLQFETRGILFVCGGRFAGLDEVAARSERHPEQSVTGEALVAFGARPEWVRHLGVIARATPFDEETLARLVTWVEFACADSPPK